MAQPCQKVRHFELVVQVHSDKCCRYWRSEIWSFCIIVSAFIRHEAQNIVTIASGCNPSPATGAQSPPFRRCTQRTSTTMADDLTDLHELQLQAFLRFSVLKRQQHVREVLQCVDECQESSISSGVSSAVSH